MADGVLDSDTMSSDNDSSDYRSKYEKAKEEAIERRIENRDLKAQMAELKSGYEEQIKSISKERDDAVKTAGELQEAYDTFTNENELHKQIESYQAEIKIRDIQEALQSVEGVSFQSGVTLADILEAAGVDVASVDELPETFAQDTLTAARTAKPFLFQVSQTETAPGRDATGEMGREAPKEATKQQPLRAFGAQAVGGGAAIPSEAKPLNVDFSDPVEALRYSRSRAVAPR